MVIGVKRIMEAVLKYVPVSSFAAAFSAFLTLLMFRVTGKLTERFKFNALFYSVILPFAGCIFFPFIKLNNFGEKGAEKIIADIKSELETARIAAFPSGLKENSVSVFEILFFIWLSVTLVLIFKTVFCHYRYLKTINSYASEKFKVGRIKIYIVAAKFPPFITNIFKPIIYLPEGQYSEDEVKMVLNHEMTHFSHNDVAKRTVISVLSCINWFNPFIQIILKRLILQMEYFCDEAVTKDMSFEGRKEYGNMLLKTKSLFVEQSEFGVGLVNSADDLKRRIGIFMSKNKNVSRRVKIVSVAIFSLIMAVSLCVSALALSQTKSNNMGQIVKTAINDFAESQNTGDKIPPDAIISGSQMPQLPIEGFSQLQNLGERVSPDVIKSNERQLPTEDMYLVSAKDNCISNLSCTNGEVILVANEDGENYFFEKGQSAVINLEADFSAEYSESAITGEQVAVGYIFEDDACDLFSGKVTGEGLSVKFTAPEEGEYVFYLCNFSAGIQNYSNIEISIN